MGVVTVHQYPIPEGKSAQQVIDQLTKLMDTLGAVKIGTFCVDCETYYSQFSQTNMNQPRILNVLHNTEYPSSCFALLDTGMCLVCDNNFDALIATMSSLFQSKKASKMENKGPKYRKGDFTVKIGLVSMGQTFKGILIEVEYGACVVPSYCWDMMREFMGSFMPPPRDPHQYLQVMFY